MLPDRVYYVKTSEPDKDRLAELVVAARGKRTSQQFAIECGVNPSTLTRILNKQNKGSSKDDLIYAIAEHAAPESGVTLDELMHANGMTKQEHGVMYGRVMNKLEETVEQILFRELLERGASIRRGNIRYNVSKTLSISPDILLLTDALKEVADEEESVWLMEVMPPALRSRADKGQYPDDRHRIFNTRQRAFQKMSRYSFASMGSIEIFRPAKFSLITTEKEIYDDLVEEFKEMNVPTNISIIYLDLDMGTVVDEFVLPKSDGKTIPAYFDKVVVQEDDGEEDLGIIKDDIDDGEE